MIQRIDMWKRIAAVMLSLMGIVLVNTSGHAQQIAIPRIDQMPDMPSPYTMRNWKRVALAYDSLAFDLARSGQYFPLAFLMANPVNYPGQTSFGLHSYVGDGRSETGEAINVLPAVVGASLCGADKRQQFGRDWVVMCQEYFNNRPEEHVYLNEPVTQSGSDWWYDVMPNVFFYQLASLHPGAGDFTRQFGLVADRWLAAVYAMGGSLAPWSHPGLEHRGWYLATMRPNNETPHEPEAGGSIAWLLYHASVATGKKEYRYGAELCMEELNAYTTNPAYELQLPYGTYLAARMNGEIGTTFDVEKMVNWCFNVSPLRSWGAVVGTWGGYDCSGLIGEVNGWNDYAFAMNTFEQIGALVPLVRYDPRFARAIGKWTLNAANASRLFYGGYLPDVNQDSRAWSGQYDPGSVLAHEALRQGGPGQVSPYATGDAIAGGWAPTNLSLYSSSHAGILGAIIDTTNVPGVLKLDLLATDYFHAPAYPTFLFYNPDSLTRIVNFAVGNGAHDLYNTVTKIFLARGITGAASISLLPRSAVVAVITPSGGTVTYDEERMLIDGIVVDYRSDHVPSNHRPRIKGFGARPSTIYLGGDAQLSCTAVDADGDSLVFEWSATGGTLTAGGSTGSWTAPVTKGVFDVVCRISDGNGGGDTARTAITVVDSALTVPVIREIVARPGKVDRGATTTVTCHANDPSGKTLTYSWLASGGTILGQDSAVQWTAPSAAGNYTLVCTVNNGQGGTDKDSVLVPVRDFSLTGTGNLILSLTCNGNLTDASSYGNPVTPTDITFVADRHGTTGHACGFNGGTSSLRIPNTAALSCDTAISVSLWFKPGLQMAKEMFLISHGSWQNRWKISLTPEGRVRWTVKTTAGVRDVDSRTRIVPGTYYFVSGIYNGADLEVYLNGEFENFVPWSGTLLKPAIDLMVGQMLPGDANYNFQGVIDEITLHDYALTSPQVKSLCQVVSSVSGGDASPVPYSTALTGIFPNPFNAGAQIQFVIAADDDQSRIRPSGEIGGYRQVSVRVYDILGRTVETLVEAPLRPGRYSAWFDGSRVASGVYWCRLTAGAHTVVGKMLLLR